MHRIHGDTKGYGRGHRFFRLHTLDHRRAGGSRVLSTGGLAILRTLFFAYTLAAWLASIILDAQSGQIRSHFVYFTYLSHTGLLFYLLASVFHTIHLRRHCDGSSFTRIPHVLQLMHWLLFASALLFSTVVSIMFWTMIYRADEYHGVRRWVNASVHGTNVGIMWVDTLVGAMVFCPHWSHPVVLALVVALYLALAYINEAVNGWFTYDFINYKEHRALEAPILLGVLLGIVLLYYVMYGVHILLDRYLPPKFASDRRYADEEDCSDTESLELK
ncbi:hypothetical protein GGI15_000743 [Coemansia interrupta]|uniref:Uncharacterized protein n=1 Tax=Coemansia interrupta TaxID=1126814 RepID=A0A9W8HQH4_9FUNG|nr:hypothetical protein GGI15_000743 [Coemansia interrupta]